ncbi:MAG: hypothetical protein ACJ79U_01720, partial [Myxococcales bacterium]
MTRPTLRAAGKIVAAALVSSVGCATANHNNVAWPAPPAKERIRHVRTYSSGADMEGSFARTWRKIAGLDAPVSLYHPVGVAVTPSGDLLAVSDQAIGSLFLFDFKAGQLRTVPKEALGGPPMGVAIAGEAVWVVVPERKAALSFDRAARPLAAI